jgi:hypothetical protein
MYTPGHNFVDPSTSPNPCNIEYSSTDTGPPYVTGDVVKASFNDKSNLDSFSLDAIFNKSPSYGLYIYIYICAVKACQKSESFSNQTKGRVNKKEQFLLE